MEEMMWVGLGAFGPTAPPLLLKVMPHKHIEEGEFGCWTKWEVTHHQGIWHTTGFIYHHNVGYLRRTE